MSWGITAAVGLQVVGSMRQSSQSKGMIKAQRVVDTANAEAENMNRDSQRRVSAATTALSNYARSINNKRAVTAGGAKLDAIRTNAARAADTMRLGGIAQRTKSIEDMGAVSAMASAAGVGGSSLDVVKRTMRLRRSIQEDQLGKIENQQRHDFKASETAAISEMVGNFDVATSVASMDYGISTPAIRGSGPNAIDTLLNPRIDWSMVRDAAYGLNSRFNAPVNTTPVTADLGSGLGTQTFGNTGTGYDLGSGLGATQSDFFA